MILYQNIESLFTLQGAAQKRGRLIVEGDLSIIRNGAFGVDKGRIVWVGSAKQARNLKVKKRVDLDAETVFPAFLECHTHTVFAGDRQNEFELRNRGFSYQEIAQQGGGINATVTATRKAKANELLKLLQEREVDFLRQGVATLEVKSGYGLDRATEIKLLNAINCLRRVRAVPTFLGAHAVPPEHRSADSYLLEIKGWLPEVRKLCRRIDIFMEKGYFSNEQAGQLFQWAKDLGFDFLAHADQMNGTGASVFAAEAGAISVDHCLNLSDAEILKLAKFETTCVLLPASDFYLRIPYPPARRLIEAGARVALATDFNPGTAPTKDLGFVGVLARLEMKMTWPEVLVAYTLNAAYALNLAKDLGSIEIGKSADFVVSKQTANRFFYEVG